MVARGLLDGARVAALTGEIDAWIAESRAREVNYGETTPYEDDSFFGLQGQKSEVR